MGFLTHWPIILLFVIVLIILGPGKLPQIGGAIGGAIKEFRKSTSDKEEVTGAGDPAAPVAAAALPSPAEPNKVVGHAEALPSSAERADVSPKQEAPEAPKA